MNFSYPSSPFLRLHIIREKGRNRKEDPLLSLDLLNTHRISSEVPLTQGIDSELLARCLTQEETGPGPSLPSRKGSALWRDFSPGAGCHGLGLAVWGKMKNYPVCAHAQAGSIPTPFLSGTPQLWITSCMLGVEIQVIALQKCIVWGTARGDKIQSFINTFK